MTKWVYNFNKKKSDGSRTMKDLLGGKGANLAEMCSLGLNVPPGFTITTEACLDFEKEKGISQEIKKEVEASVKEVESFLAKEFGSSSNPLLFSIRSGAKVSMPGMMDTVLNLGLNDETVVSLGKLTDNERFAWDSYRRFIQMFANVVMGFNNSLLESTLEDLKEAREVEEDVDLSAEDFKDLVKVYKDIILQETGISFPQDPKDQLWKAIEAVFSSWNNPRAIKYRNINNISHDMGTAVNVQSMVFGNMGDNSATGVCFTRDPSTGDKKFFGEFLVNAQGEDVVAGIRTPAPINEESKNDSNKSLKTLKEIMPKAYNELVEIYKKLEIHYKDMQDIEFTIEDGSLYLLQTRNGKRTAAAAIQIAVDLVKENILTKNEALLSIDADSINQLLHPRLDPNAKKMILTKGLPASPGAACGKICFHPERAHALAEEGEKVLLVRLETSPEDIVGMAASEGILTATGGMTSHAAVVARGMGKPCVAGCSDLEINYEKRTLIIKDNTFSEGDFLTIDGALGEVLLGQIPTIDAEISENFTTIMSWADSVRKLKVRANADNPEDSNVAIKFGAEGIGLCRTEHMFFEDIRVLAVREMIFAQNEVDRKKALDKLLPFQKEDFINIFKAMEDKPVNIRLLDPPLHEFLPHSKEDKEGLAKSLDISLDEIEKRAKDLFEFNPMLGHRGCRLAISYPEIAIMQTKAIFEAAMSVIKDGINPNIEVMIPFVSVSEEVLFLKNRIKHEIKKIIGDQKVNYKIGTMIELPRAAICADQIADSMDFFSFGTNDLTQTTFGLSRDDSSKFLLDYKNKGIMLKDPFVSMDQDGVGFLVDLATKKGRSANSKLHVGICGEHGGDPSSIYFCHNAGLDYVSCSPYRVPVARLAAAQAVLLNE